jgi:hypothetical protein
VCVSFVTEGAGLPVGFGAPGGGARLWAEPLGLSSAVPRFLRWDAVVELQQPLINKKLGAGVPAHAAFLAQLARLWRIRAAAEAASGVAALSTHVYSLCVAQVTATDGGNHAGGSCRSGTAWTTCSASSKPCRSSSDLGSEVVGKGPVGEDNTTSDIAAAGYNFYHALVGLRHVSAAADGAWLALTGQLPEAFLHEQSAQAGGLVRALQAAAVARISSAQLPTVLSRLWPLKSRDALAALVDSMSQLLTAIKSDPERENLQVCSSSDSDDCTVLTDAVAALSRAAALAVPWSPRQEISDDSCGLEEASVRPAALATLESAHQLLELVLRQHIEDVLSYTRTLMHQLSLDLGSVVRLHDVVQHISHVLSSANGGTSSTCMLSQPAVHASASQMDVADGDISTPLSNQALCAPSQAASNGPVQPAGLEDWLASARHAIAHRNMDVPHLLAWMQRAILLLPSSVTQDVAGTLRWCLKAAE